MTHSKPGFVSSSRTYTHYTPMHHQSPSAFTRSHPSFSPFNASSRKRSRLQFEPSNPDYAFQTPTKRPKLSNHNFTQPNHNNNTNYNNHDSFDDDTKHNTEKNRGFQNHSDKLQSNGMKIRRESILKQRRMQRQFVLHQNHQNVIKSQLSEPNYWRFNCNTKPHRNDNESEPQKGSSVDSMDSDEVMTEYRNENNNESNFNPMRNDDDSHLNRSSFIPKTCPNPRKSRSKRNVYQNTSNTEHKCSINEGNEYIERDVNEPNIESEEHIIDDKCDVNREEKENLNSKEKEKQRRKEQKKKERDELIRKRSEKRIKEMKNDKLNEVKREKMKNELRERIHPIIVQKAHPFRNNVIELIKLFYPKTRIGNNAKNEDILKAFKRALASFHPDRTINQSLREQIEAEEVFKLLSTQKEEYQRRHNKNKNSAKPYQSYNKRRHTKHGWF